MGRPGSTRLRRRRLAAAVSALTVTAVAVLGGVGLLPSDPPVRQVAFEADRSPSTGTGPGSADHEPRPVTRAADSVREHDPDTPGEEVLAADSGEGRRVVFDISAQRVWLVGAEDRVRRTYLVSGSVTDNLQAGEYDVYSRSARAWGIDDSGTMRFMVRFAHGDHAAIGFHDIPVKDGERVQTRAELGSPRSHGCIRQARPDAKALWDFAPVGTPVVVLA